jgi:hypothetical protein
MGISRLAVGENKPFLRYLLSHRNLLTINHRVVSELSAVATFPREQRGKRGKYRKVEEKKDSLKFGPIEWLLNE